MSELALLLDRCATENPLEVYYDMIDAIYVVKLTDAAWLRDALTCAQVCLLRLHKARDALIHQAFTLITGRLFRWKSEGDRPPAFVANLALDFVAPFIAEVAIDLPITSLDGLWIPEDVESWQSAVGTCQRLSPPTSAVPEAILTTRRHNRAAFLLHVLDFLVFADSETAAVAGRRAIGDLLLLGFDGRDVLDHVWTLYTRQRLGIEDRGDDDTDSDEDSKGPSNKALKRSEWTLGGVAGFAYIVGVVLHGSCAFPLFPSPLKPLYILRCVTFCIPAMMTRGPSLQVPFATDTDTVDTSTSTRSTPLTESVYHRALQLLGACCQCVPLGTNFSTDVSLGHRSPEYSLSLQVVSFMVGCPDKDLRTLSLRVYEAYIATFHVQARFWLLREVMSDCPFDTVTGLLLNMLRRDLMKYLPSPPFHNNAVLTLMYSLLAGVKDFGSDGLTERHELHMGLLTFYRALLLKEKSVMEKSGVVCTGVWQPSELKRMRDGYLHKLAATLHSTDTQSSTTASTVTPSGGVVSITAPTVSRDNDPDVATAKRLLEAALEPVLELIDTPPTLSVTSKPTQ